MAREARDVLRDVLQGLQDAEVRGGLGLPRVAPGAIGVDLAGGAPSGLRPQGSPEPLIG